MEIRFQSTDLTTPTTTASQSGSFSTQGSFPQSEPVDTQDGGLSTGAQAGIGVGVAIGALAIILLAWLLWRRRKKAHEGRLGELPGTEPLRKDGSAASPSELETSTHVQRYEMYVEPSELDGHGGNREVDHGRAT